MEKSQTVTSANIDSILDECSKRHAVSSGASFAIHYIQAADRLSDRGRDYAALQEINAAIEKLNEMKKSLQK